MNEKCYTKIYSTKILQNEIMKWITVIINLLVEVVCVSAPGGEAFQAVDEGWPHPLNDTFAKELPTDVTKDHHDPPRSPGDRRGGIRETREEWRPNVVDFRKKCVLQQ